MLPKQPVEEVRVLLTREPVGPYDRKPEISFHHPVAVGAARRHDNVIVSSTQLRPDRQEGLQVARRAVRRHDDAFFRRQRNHTRQGS